MRDDDLPMGVGPDGKPWPVHATASPDYGAGALLGLVAGLEAGPELGALGALTASLMRRGRFVLEEAPALPHVLAAVPISLFYAHDPDAVITALAYGAPDDALAATLVGGAIAAGTHALADGENMAIAGVQALDRAAATLGDAAADAHARLRAAMRSAVGGDAPGAGLAGPFWHLLHTDDLAGALRDMAARGDRQMTAVTGALLGAALGRDGVDAELHARLAADAAPLLALLADDEDDGDD